jgi:hypothetical protein
VGRNDDVVWIGLDRPNNDNIIQDDHAFHNFNWGDGKFNVMFVSLISPHKLGQFPVKEILYRVILSTLTD